MGLAFYFFALYRFLVWINRSIYNMKTTVEDWQKALEALHGREKGISSEHQIDYKTLLKKVHIGNLVLDVGCGTMWLKKMLPADCVYHGMDAFLPHIKDERSQMSIESMRGSKKAYYDTLFIFAALDGMRDLEQAFDGIRSITKKNVVILTGINIEPDRFHTHLITEELIANQMDGFRLTHRTQVHPKIVFLEYTRI